MTFPWLPLGILEIVKLATLPLKPVAFAKVWDYGGLQDYPHQEWWLYENISLGQASVYPLNEPINIHELHVANAPPVIDEASFRTYVALAYPNIHAMDPNSWSFATVYPRLNAPCPEDAIAGPVIPDPVPPPVISPPPRKK